MSETASPRQRRILHLDVDAMFVQCAVLDDPDRLAHEKLIVVGGSPKGRGVVTSASYGAREFGVRSAMSMATALRLCPRAVVVRVPGDMVREKSHQIAGMLNRWTPVASMASVDEGYLDLTGTEGLYHHEPLEDTARRIQRELKGETELDVSIGGGTNRLVAKLATSFAKPAGVYVVEPGEEANFVGRLEISDLLGVGPSLLKSLDRHGITTMRQLRALDVETMASWWGAERADWLWRRCRGIDDAPIRTERGARSCSSERTFYRDINDDLELDKALLGQVVDAAGSMRRKGLFARTITVKIRNSQFNDRSRGRTVRDPVQTDRAIHSIARELLGELREARREPIRLIGVGLTNLTEHGHAEQQSMLEVAPTIEDERDRHLAGVIDKIRGKHGSVIGPGSVVTERAKRRRERRDREP